MTLEHFYEDQDVKCHENKQFFQMRSALDGTIVLRLSSKNFRTFFDPKKDHLLHFSARYFDEILKDVMSGFNGSNYYQRRLINDSFKFEMLESNHILVEEG